VEGVHHVFVVLLKLLFDKLDCLKGIQGNHLLNVLLNFSLELLIDERVTCPNLKFADRASSAPFLIGPLLKQIKFVFNPLEDVLLGLLRRPDFTLSHAS